ncbi:hypothetical protein KCP73_21470 [Salmonella enterica subsp. enterica]|nr:hypothetical protein KCP73_21470 [Salmonella enterica subsp. enterica]
MRPEKEQPDGTLTRLLAGGGPPVSVGVTATQQYFGLRCAIVTCGQSGYKYFSSGLAGSAQLTPARWPTGKSDITAGLDASRRRAPLNILIRV